MSSSLLLLLFILFTPVSKTPDFLSTTRPLYICYSSPITNNNIKVSAIRKDKWRAAVVSLVSCEEKYGICIRLDCQEIKHRRAFLISQAVKEASQAQVKITVKQSEAVAEADEEIDKLESKLLLLEKNCGKLYYMIEAQEKD